MRMRAPSGLTLARAGATRKAGCSDATVGMPVLGRVRDMLLVPARIVARVGLPGAHEIGPVTVMSLVPSGKVASTCSWASISGTPSMTSCRRST